MTPTQHLYLVILFLLSCSPKPSALEPLRSPIMEVVQSKNAVVGVAVMSSDGKDTLSIHGDMHLPLQSVFKYHIAVAMLAQVDAGEFALDQEIEVTPDQLLPDLYSPLRDENPNGGKFTIRKLIQYAVSQSDNVACDVLLRLLGGPNQVEAFFKKYGITDISIAINEETMQGHWDRMFENWITAKAAVESLRIFYDNAHGELSNSSHAFLWQTMKETSTGTDRLKGQLPEGTVVAHKTGYSGTNDEGWTEAVNDIGIVFLPDGRYYYIAVLVSHSKENDESNARIISAVNRVVWDGMGKK